MDIIYECAAKFVALEDTTYRFVVSQHRKCTELHLNFSRKDFYHLAGFQYLKDINIPKNRQKTISTIIEDKSITDDLLRKSQFFTSSNHLYDIQSRICELRFLEEYLDANNIIRIYNTQYMKHLHSAIQADYLIESQLPDSKDTVYIFLKRREDNPAFLCVVSFFKKGNITYGGDILYWMLKEKITLYQRILLYQHPNYVD